MLLVTKNIPSSTYISVIKYNAIEYLKVYDFAHGSKYLSVYFHMLQVVTKMAPTTHAYIWHQ